MKRETCVQCERDFMENQSVGDFNDFLDGKLNQYPEFGEMCVKCFVRILNRYINN